MCSGDAVKRGGVVKGPVAANPLRRHGLHVTPGIAAVVLVLLAACTGSGSPTGSGGSPQAEGSSSSPSAVAFSACVRSHGVPNFPDPDSSGGIPKETSQQLGVSSSQYQAAAQACGHLLPGGNSGRT